VGGLVFHEILKNRRESTTRKALQNSLAAFIIPFPHLSMHLSPHFTEGKKGNWNCKGKLMRKKRQKKLKTLNSSFLNDGRYNTASSAP